MQRKKLNKGIILSSVSQTCEKLYKKIPQSMIGNVFSKEGKAYTGIFSYISGALKFKKRVSTPFKRFMAKAFDKSFILNKMKQIVSAIPRIQLRTIGLFLFALGLFSSVTTLLERGLGGVLNGISDIFIPLLIAVVGGIFTLSQKSCYEAVTDSKLLSRFIFNLIGVKKRDKYIEETIIMKGHIGFIAGIIAGIFGTLTDPLGVIVFILSILIIVAVMWAPEYGVVAMFLAIPFISSTHCAILTAFVAFSWIVKLIRGKRTLKFGFFEFILSAFAIAILFGGSISLVPSISSHYSLLMVSGILSYFVIANNVKTAEWVRRCVNAILLSFSIKLIYGSVGILSSYLEATRFSFATELIGESSYKLFTYNSYLAVVCVALLPFFMLGMSRSRKASSRYLYLILTAMAIYCLICGHSSGALISVLLSAMLLLMLYTPKSLGIIASSLIFVPICIALLPNSVSAYLLKLLNITGSSIYSNTNDWLALCSNLGDALMGGIGLGKQNAELIFPIYRSSINSYSIGDIYTALTLGIGITGLFLLAVLIFSFTRKFFTYLRTSKNDAPVMKNICMCSFTGAISILIMGFTANIFEDPSVFSLFFYLCAITICSANIARKDRSEFISDGPYLDILYKQTAATTVRKDV